MTAADAFREIATQVADVRRKLDKQDRYAQAVRGDLFAIQRLAQDGLREALVNEPKLAAASMMADFIATWKDALAGTAMSVQDFNETSGLKEYNAAIATAATTSTGEPT